MRLSITHRVRPTAKKPALLDGATPAVPVHLPPNFYYSVECACFFGF
jgi:hypothetical protein